MEENSIKENILSQEPGLKETKVFKNLQNSSLSNSPTNENESVMETLLTPLKNANVIEDEDIQIVDEKILPGKRGTTSANSSPSVAPSSAKRRRLSKEEIENREKARLERAAKLAALQVF